MAAAMNGDARDRVAFVRAHTALAPVPFTPEIQLHTATDVVPLWRATESWLAERGLAVPFWSVPWAGGQALARWVLDAPACVAGKRVLDFGSGSGLVAIAAALAGARSVVAVDIDATAIAAIALNASANGVVIEATCADIVGEPVDADVLLAGDIWYERAPAASFAAWFRGLRGVDVYTGDPGRHYVPADAFELARYDVPTTAELESAPSRITRVLRVGRSR